MCANVIKFRFCASAEKIYFLGNSESNQLFANGLSNGTSPKVGIGAKRDGTAMGGPSA